MAHELVASVSRRSRAAPNVLPCASSLSVTVPPPPSAPCRTPPEWLGQLHEQLVPSADRRRRGADYTPSDVAAASWRWPGGRPCRRRGRPGRAVGTTLLADPAVGGGASCSPACVLLAGVRRRVRLCGACTASTSTRSRSR
ncbi:MAG: hypothetical protein QM757_14630 [Paludibaculum sp.]